MEVRTLLTVSIQQSPMIIFVFLIIAYVWLMDRLDEEFDVHED